MKHLIFSLTALAAILLFSLVNGLAVNHLTDTWIDQIEYAADLASRDQWAQAESQMKKSHRDWTSRQQYLHIVLKHDAINEVQTVYHRAIAFCAQEESADFYAEVSALSALLTILAETEEFSLNNLF